MSAAVEAYRAAVEAFLAVQLQYNTDLATYDAGLAGLNSDDPCTEFFASRLDILDKSAAELNEAREKGIVLARNVDTAYNALGVFEKLSSEVRALKSRTEQSLKAEQSISTAIKNQPKTRQQLRADMQACNKTEVTNTPTNTPQNLTNDDATTSSNTTSQNAAQTNQVNTPPADNSKVGKRLFNPLSKFASYTYQISLYMVSPSAYEAFMNNGRKQISDIGYGVYVVAQSGGVPTDSTKLQRPPGFLYDYFIDNVRFKTPTGAKNDATDVNTTAVTFTITEPNGFSFISNLTKAYNAIKKVEFRNKIDDDRSNAARQFFVMGIRFFGYDADGNLVKDAEVIERYIDMYIVTIRFKIDGKHTVYNVTAASIAPTMAFGNKNGRLDAGAYVVAGSVKDALKGDGENTYGLIDKLNDDQRTHAEQNGFLPLEYDVKFIGDGVDRLENAKLYMDTDLEKLRWPTKVPGLIKRTTDAQNEISSIKAVNAAGVSNLRQIVFKEGTSILHAINNIIARSSYLTDALKVVYDSTSESDSKEDDNKDAPDGTAVKESPNRNILRWYNVSAVLSNIRYDNKRQDYAYKVTFVIQPYEVPNIQSSFVKLTSKYYGPHKRYEYWFTGQNNEILSYEQKLDGQWYMADYNPDSSSEAGSGWTNVPYSVGQVTNADRTAAMGLGAQAQASVINNLYSPGSYIEVKINILGDPDFIMQESVSSINQVYNQFYGTDDFTINAAGGQVFVELDFKEGVDYNYEENDGLLSLNDSILFWAYPPKFRERIKGNSYQVISVDSDFTKGRFTQTLNCVINTLPGLEREFKENNRNETVARPDNNNALDPTGGGQGAVENPRQPSNQPAVQPPDYNEIATEMQGTPLGNNRAPGGLAGVLDRRDAGREQRPSRPGEFGYQGAGGAGP